MRLHRPRYRNVAGALIASSVVTGVITLIARTADSGSTALRFLEAATLLLAAAAYFFYALAHHNQTREVATRLILVTAFVLWSFVQITPRFSGAAWLNDLTILLFVVDLAILLSPAR